MRLSPKDSELLRVVASRLRPDAASGMEPSPDCLADDVVAALAQGVPQGQAPAEALRHLAGCEACRERVAAVARLLGTDAVAAELRRLEVPGTVHPTRRVWLRVAGGLAAAALLTVLVRGIVVRPQYRTLRDGPLTTIPAPVPLQPAGVVARVDSLSWRTVPRATQYRVTLFAADGSTVWDTGTGDSAVALPPGVRLAPGAVYYWKVEARTDWNRWTASDLVEIRIGGPR